MLKKELRYKYKKARAGLSEKEQLVNSDLILINFQKLQLPVIQCVLSYLAVPGEIDTSLILRYLQFQNTSLQVAVPRIDESSETFDAVELQHGDPLQTNHLGIPEPTGATVINPQEIDVAIVPLLAYDTKGFRVGFGKGYFDKFLAHCNADIIKIGLSHFEPEEPIGDISTFDIPLNFCITPHKIFSF